MGFQKKRRKSAPLAEEIQQHKRSAQSTAGRGPPAPLAWTSAGLQAVLPADRQVLFIGRGTLAVQSGELYIAGRIVDASNGPLELAADARVGGPLLVEVVPGSGQVPLASCSEAVFSITRIAGSTGCAAAAGGADGLVAPAAGSGAGSRLSRLGFEAWVDDEPSAPMALLPPPLWRQALTEIAVSLAAGTAAAAPPALIVICGAKKVGKSTFARLLANTLLNQVPTVAYLDTGEQRA